MGARGLEAVRAYAACDEKAAIASPGSGTRVFFRSRRARGACWRTVGARRPAPAASARARTPTPRLPHARSHGLTSQAMRMLSPSQDGAMRGVDHALGATPLFPIPIFGHAAKLRVCRDDALVLPRDDGRQIFVSSLRSCRAICAIPRSLRSHAEVYKHTERAGANDAKSNAPNYRRLLPPSQTFSGADSL